MVLVREEGENFAAHIFPVCLKCLRQMGSRSKPELVDSVRE